MALNSWIVGAGCALLAGAVQSACYTVYKGEQVVYQSSGAPVDMSLPFSQTVPRVFGAGAVLVFRPDSDACQLVGEPAPRASAVVDSQAEVQSALNALGQAYRHVGIPHQSSRGGSQITDNGRSTVYRSAVSANASAAARAAAKAAAAAANSK
jgi:hypothetical protein